MMRRDGTGQKRLTSGREDASPAWSPTGKTLYFSRFISGEDKYGDYGFAVAIFRMRPDGSGLRQLTRPELEDHGVCHESPAPSHDGRLIAFADFYTDCEHGWDMQISAIDQLGREATLGKFKVGYGFDPAWSPDGRLLAYAGVDEYGAANGIKVAASNGSPAARSTEARLQTRHGLSTENGSLSPRTTTSGSYVATVPG